MPDPRIGLLEAFFVKYKCPDESAAFIAAADAYGIDYRVLPVIWLKESQCGLHQPKNGNGFGFANGATPYASTTDAIWHITQTLAQGKYYAGKTIKQKIQTYNSVNPTYYSSFYSYTQLINKTPLQGN